MSQQDQDYEEPQSSVALHLWSHAEVLTAVPYLRAVLRSLRDEWLEMRCTRERIRRIDSRSGRPNRLALIAREEARREAELAQRKVKETEEELLALDVFCLDPARGLALVPFLHASMPAWFVFDLFSPEGLDSWRLHSDPLDMRRPLEALEEPSPWAPGWPW